MREYYKLSHGVRAAIACFLFSLGLFTFFRGVFYLSFHGKAEPYTMHEVLKAFVLGLRFDTRLAILLALPLLIITAFTKKNWAETPPLKKLLVNTYTIVFVVIILIYTLDLGYYAYLESRVNFTVFQFLKNPLISAQMVYESYNVILWSFALTFLAFLIYQILNRFIFNIKVKPGPERKTPYYIQGAILSFLSILSLHGSLNQYPLRWSEAFFTQNMFVAYLAMNPVHYLFDTATGSKQNYDKNKVSAHYETLAKYLGVKELNKETLNFQRPLELTQKFDRPNIVYIVMESMAAYKTGLFGNTPDASPSLDQLAKNGWLFRNYYVPTEGTARSVFCILTGVPDINAKSTSSRNPLIIDQHTFINSFKGYEKYYFIGGSANWGNIRGVYMNNIKGLEMYEEERLGGPRTDVWGLSDLDLFRQTAKVLKAREQKEPFFALIQSASFHRPYTIPEDHGEFQLKHLSETELTKYGFASNEEYNSFRFADYSLGEFFRQIKDTEFYKNTLFVIQGDHGLPHYGAEHLKEGYKFFGINRFHTPLLIHSPLIKTAEEFNMMITEPDVIPTLAGITGHPFTNTSLGRNVFAIDPKENRYAFSYVYYTDPLQVLLYDGEFLAFGTEKKIESLHRYLSDDSKTDVKEKYPEKFKEMADLLVGIFEGSKYIVHHNPKLPEDK